MGKFRRFGVSLLTTSQSNSKRRAEAEHAEACSVRDGTVPFSFRGDERLRGNDGCGLLAGARHATWGSEVMRRTVLFFSFLFLFFCGGRSIFSSVEAARVEALRD
jgi:hypothetical protein